MIPLWVPLAVVRAYTAGLILRRFAVLLVALILIVVGIVSLYLSYAVAQGWWQGTSQAFGVGFAVGGLVDVLAIAGLDTITRTSERRDRELGELRKDLETLTRTLAPREDDTTETDAGPAIAGT